MYHTFSEMVLNRGGFCICAAIFVKNEICGANAKPLREKLGQKNGAVPGNEISERYIWRGKQGSGISFTTR
jgi:hypothetical protein